MTDLTALKQNIQVEETDYRAPVGQNLMQKIGGAINFINANIVYHLFPVTNFTISGVDYETRAGILVFNKKVKIVACSMFIVDNIFQAYLEMDLVKIAGVGGAQTSMFTTAPRMSNAVAAGAWIGLGETLAGCTAPVLIDGIINAGEAIQASCVQILTAPTRIGLSIGYIPL